MPVKLASAMSEKMYGSSVSFVMTFYPYFTCMSKNRLYIIVTRIIDSVIDSE